MKTFLQSLTDDQLIEMIEAYDKGFPGSDHNLVTLTERNFGKVRESFYMQAVCQVAKELTIRFKSLKENSFVWDDQTIGSLPSL